MTERLTWEEIQKKYPDQWVGLTNVEYEADGANIASAVVSDCTSSKDELGLKMLKGELISRYTTPNNCGLQLGLVGVTLCA